MIKTLKNKENGNFIEFQIKEREIKIITEDDKAKLVGNFNNFSLGNFEELLNQCKKIEDIENGSSEIETFETALEFLSKTISIEELYINCNCYDESSADWNGYAESKLKLAKKVEINFLYNEFISKINNQIFVSNQYNDNNYLLIEINKNEINFLPKFETFVSLDEFTNYITDLKNQMKQMQKILY